MAFKRLPTDFSTYYGGIHDTYSDRLLTQLLPFIAVCFSMTRFLSYWTLIANIHKVRNTKKCHFAPFYFLLMESIMLLLYAIMIDNSFFALCGGAGAILGTYYMTIFYRYMIDKRIARITLIVGILVVWFFLLESKFHVPHESNRSIGIPLVGLMAINMILPFRWRKDTKDTSNYKNEIGETLTRKKGIIDILRGLTWCLYALFIKDYWVFSGNVMVMLFGVVQIIVLVIRKE